MKLSEEQCKYLIDTAESKNQWSRIRGGSKTSYETVTLAVDDDALIELFSSYCLQELNLQLRPSKVAIIKYQEGDSIQKHIDKGSDFPDPNKFTRDAVYNINIRLNENYEGGEFFLDDNLFFKPVGEIYHYNSDVYHEVKKITQGIRYIALISVSYEDTIVTKTHTLI